MLSFFLELVDIQGSSELILLLFPVIRDFLNKDAQTITVDVGQSLRIPCPAHRASYGAVYTWAGDENIEFSRNSRRAISPSGELFIMYVTEDDITRIQQLKGIRCIMTGANTIYDSGPITLVKSGNNLLWHNTLYCLTVGHPHPQRLHPFRSAPRIATCGQFLSMCREFVSYPNCSQSYLSVFTLSMCRSAASRDGNDIWVLLDT